MEIATLTMFARNDDIVAVIDRSTSDTQIFCGIEKLVIRIIVTILALLYAISPIDILPEKFLGPRGFIDDIVVLWFLYRYLKTGQVPFGGFRKKPSGQSGGTKHGSAGQTGSGQTSDPEGARFASKDPYVVLGISRGSSTEEIKTAYRELAGRYHPDKVAHLGEEFQQLAEQRFKAIQAAYQSIHGKSA
jgi:DnaJ like chaperone protein